MYSIILIHGFQGNPYHTWADRPHKTEKPSKRAQQKPRKRDIRQWFRRSQRKPKNETEGLEDIKERKGKHEKTERIFWPGALLPNHCPKARILVYGYDTRVVGHGVAVNKNHLYSHGKDFIYDLCRHRPIGRPLIFISHSLGGIIVKEVCLPEKWPRL